MAIRSFVLMQHQLLFPHPPTLYPLSARQFFTLTNVFNSPRFLLALFLFYYFILTEEQF